MRLKNINFDIDTKIAQCMVEYSPAENISSIFFVSLTDEELTLLSENWWVAEVKQVLSIKLNTNVE